MVVGVEQMRGVPFFEFRQTKGFWELSQLHGKERHGVDETYTGRKTLKLENFTTVVDLTQLETKLMQCVDDRITVVPLEIMGDDHQRLFAIFAPVLQGKEKLSNAHVTVPPMKT